MTLKRKEYLQEEVYIDPFTDEGFKIIFGTENQSEEIIRGFLNQLMKDDPDFGNIEKIVFRPTERNRQRKGAKTIVYDVLCETESKKRYIVEMQQEKDSYFLNRVRYYMSRAIVDQGRRKKGDPEWSYDPLYPVVGVFLCDFHIEGLRRKLITRVGNMDLDDKVPVGNHTREYYLQLPEFNKTPEECVEKIDQWIYILKHMPTLQIIPFDIRNDAALTQLDEVSRIAALKEAQRQRYDAALRRKRDRLSQLDTARTEGEKIGIEKGEKIGEKKKQNEIARKMTVMGVDDAMISEITGLTIKEIEEL